LAKNSARKETGEYFCFKDFQMKDSVDHSFISKHPQEGNTARIDSLPPSNYQPLNIVL
jgi:hypothetical protein